MTVPARSWRLRGGLLQRKCAGGGTPGPSGECAECGPKRLALRTNLAINQPGDQYEQEADRVVEAVVGGTTSQRLPISSFGDAAVQREDEQLDLAVLSCLSISGGNIRSIAAFATEIPDDKEVLSTARSASPNPERYAWRIKRPHRVKATTSDFGRQAGHGLRPPRHARSFRARTFPQTRERSAVLRDLDLRHATPKPPPGPPVPRPNDATFASHARDRPGPSRRARQARASASSGSVPAEEERARAANATCQERRSKAFDQRGAPAMPLRGKPIRRRRRLARASGAGPFAPAQRRSPNEHGFRARS